MKQPTFITVTLDTIVGGGQALGTLDSGKKSLCWGGLPGEQVTARVTKKKAHFVEAVVTEVAAPSPERIEPQDPDSFLSTSPWQIMTFNAEQHYKAALIEEAFELHDIVLPNPISVYSNNITARYRNKVEFSWYSTETIDAPGETLDLAFFRRGSKGKIPVESCSLLPSSIMQLALAVRDMLRTKNITARQLKTLLIRADQQGNCVWQLYVKQTDFTEVILPHEAKNLPAQGGEIIYSDPKSPASRITKRLAAFGDVTLTDTILGVPFRYACEGFFQVNVPVYEHALKDIEVFATTTPGKLIDLYAGVGSIGLTVSGNRPVTLVELNADAVREMKQNIASLKKGDTATAVLAPSEKALEYITGDATIIVDPPRAGLHTDVIERLRTELPQRIIYLSCNPVTQARDITLLAKEYGIAHHAGYNFFPRTPHIEHLVVLQRLS